MCEEGLKKRYRNIPVGDRLPVGLLESDHMDLLSSTSHDEANDPLPDVIT